jgi:hypothetical protein
MPARGTDLQPAGVGVRPPAAIAFSTDLKNTLTGGRPDREGSRQGHRTKTGGWTSDVDRARSTTTSRPRSSEEKNRNEKRPGMVHDDKRLSLNAHRRVANHDEHVHR